MNSKNNKGVFITLEGPDGSGKSTACKFITQYLKERNIPYVLTREPGGTEIGEDIRNVLLDNNNAEMTAKTEALLYAAARAQHIEEKIKPLLNQGYVVISDRFVLSSLAYQGYGRELGYQEVKNINDFAIESLGEYTNNVIFFDVDLETSNKRVNRRKNIDRLENAGVSFHQKVHAGYKAILCELEKEIISNGTDKYNLAIIDANKTIPQVKKQVEGSMYNLLEV